MQFVSGEDAAAGCKRSPGLRESIKHAGVVAIRRLFFIPCVRLTGNCKVVSGWDSYTEGAVCDRFMWSAGEILATGMG